jgi:hypothetical protein
MLNITSGQNKQLREHLKLLVDKKVLNKGYVQSSAGYQKSRMQFATDREYEIA